jgi:LIVCS family branched-chain amino acid:cation transporter
MDLVAAFFFSGFVIKHLHRTATSRSDEASYLKLFFKASLIGSALLFSVYFALVLLGWLYAPLLSGTPPQEMFGRIALESLGPLAVPSVCITVIFACLTTAIALTSLFAEFLRTEVVRDKIDNRLALIITLGIAFAVSTLEFAGIANFLAPILEIMYPALIILTMYNIGCKIYGIKSMRETFISK